ncbi:MAG: YggT family protein [Pseudomonadota bacterium]|nr:MAG: YggT family protein [Pseudomonadota bacterium]
MGGHYFSNAAEFLIGIVFGLYILAVMLRFLLQLVRADFYNPVSQFLVKITNPVLRPLRRIIPGVGGIDIASVVLLIALQCAEMVVIRLLPRYTLPTVPGLAVMAIGQLLGMVVTIFFVSILVQVVLSWVNPQAAYHNPLARLVHQLNEPLLRPLRRIIPSTGGLDLSPLLASIALALAYMLVVQPIVDLGGMLAYPR